MRYNAVLSERNRYLKVGSDEDMLSIYDRQLAEHGQAIYEKRKRSPNGCNPSSASTTPCCRVGANRWS